MPPKKLVLPPGLAEQVGAADPAQQPQPRQLNLNPRDLEDVTCDKCGNYTFVEVTLMKRVSPILTGTGQEAFVPMAAYACAACNHIPDRFVARMSGWFNNKAPDGRAVASPPVQPTVPAVPPPDTAGVVASNIPGLETAPTE